MERGSVTKSQQGKTAYVEESGRVFFSGRHVDNVPKEIHAVSVMTTIASDNSGSGQRRKVRSSSPAPNSKAKTDGELFNSDESSDTRSQILC